LISAPKAKTMPSGRNIATQPRIVICAGRRVAQDREELIGRADRPGHARGDDHCHGHQPVDLVHMGAKPFVDLSAGADAYAADRVIFSH
jgi:hypothetical protein